MRNSPLEEKARQAKQTQPQLLQKAKPAKKRAPDSDRAYSPIGLAPLSREFRPGEQKKKSSPSLAATTFSQSPATQPGLWTTDN